MVTSHPTNSGGRGEFLLTFELQDYTKEVFFRDTAHGFIARTVATAEREQRQRQGRYRDGAGRNATPRYALPHGFGKMPLSLRDALSVSVRTTASIDSSCCGANKSVQ